MASVIETLERQLVEAARESEKPARGRLMARDLEILAWLGRVRFATLEQVGRRFALGRSQRFHRVGLLVDVGFLIRHPQLFGLGPPVLLATPAGLAAAQSVLATRGGSASQRVELAPAFIDARSFAHDLELAGLTVDYELDGASVLTERELASLARREAIDSSRYALELGSADERRLHFPDLIVEQDGVRTAVELEIAEKTTTRLRELLRGYGRVRSIERVLYLCPRPAVAAKVNRIAKELGLDSRVEVRDYEGPKR